MYQVQLHLLCMQSGRKSYPLSLYKLVSEIVLKIVSKARFCITFTAVEALEYCMLVLNSPCMN